MINYILFPYPILIIIVMNIFRAALILSCVSLFIPFNETGIIYLPYQQLAQPSYVARQHHYQKAKLFLYAEVKKIPSHFQLGLLARVLNDENPARVDSRRNHDPIPPTFRDLRTKWNRYLAENELDRPLFSLEFLLAEVAGTIAEEAVRGTPFSTENKVSYQRLYQTANNCYVARVQNGNQQTKWFVKAAYQETGIPNLMQELFIYDRLRDSLREESSPLSNRFFFSAVEGPVLLRLNGKYLPAIYLEFHSLPTLQTLIQVRHFAGGRNVMETVAQILEAFVLLEKAGIYVWDIKAENIMIDPKTNQVIAIDFGHSFVDGTNWLAPLNPYRISNHFYAAPEEAEAIHYKRSLKYSSSIEVWKLGILFHEILSFGQHPLHSRVSRNMILKPTFYPEGQRPQWDRYSADPVLMAETIESEYLNIHGHISAEVNPVIPMVMKMLKKNTRARYPNIRAVLDDFYRITGLRPLSERDPQAKEPSPTEVFL